MRTTIELPESVYQKSTEAARRLGCSVEQLIVQVLERETASESVETKGLKRMNPPLVRSKNPGTLDLANFNFDDLLS